MADLPTFHTSRQRPRGPVSTFAGAGTRPAALDRETVPILSEDAALILLRFAGGARGSLTVSQVSAGRKNALSFEIDGSKSALAWDSEEPNALWIGQRAEANRLLMKDPSLLCPAAARLSSYPGGHQEGYGDTMKSLFERYYAYIEKGDYQAPRDFPTFEDGHTEMQLCDALLRSARESVWVDVPCH
jgi:predicted dehydrogenase